MYFFRLIARIPAEKNANLVKNESPVQHVLGSCHSYTGIIMSVGTLLNSFAVI